jgi:pimeloyl-ACP methyl ester carboxylesterase
MADVDFVAAGESGAHVLLVHSSVSGPRMWRRLMDALKDRYRLRAVNLMGYGRTPPWPGPGPLALDDQAAIVEAAAPPEGPVYIVGHSLGGTVAMKAAARLGRRVEKLVLLEANPCYLLAQAGRREAYEEAFALRNCIKAAGASGEWEPAAAVFADYWGGAGAWAATPADRRIAFIEALKPNYYEWDCVLDETIPLEAWGDLLPRATLYVHDPATVRPIRELVELFRAAHPHWTFCEVAAGGHMAPLTRPDLVNPIVAEYLDG